MHQQVPRFFWVYLPTIVRYSRFHVIFNLEEICDRLRNEYGYHNVQIARLDIPQVEEPLSNAASCKSGMALYGLRFMLERPLSGSLTIVIGSNLEHFKNKIALSPLIRCTRVLSTVRTVQ